jgi:hypothetical protein
MKRTAYYSIIFLVWFSILTKPGKLFAMDHVYPYAKGDVWGLCTADRTPLTDPLYSAISTKGIFILGQLAGGNHYDIYSADGKRLIGSINSPTLINDTLLLVMSGKSNSRNAPDTSTISVLKGSTVVVHYDFHLDKALNYGWSDNTKIYMASYAGHKGIYDLIRDRALLPARYQEAKVIGSGGNKELYFMGWNSNHDYIVLNAQGKEIAVAEGIRHADFLDPVRGVFIVGTDKYTLDGKKLDKNLELTSASELFLMTTEKQSISGGGYVQKTSPGWRTIRSTLTDLRGNVIEVLPGYHDSMYKDLGHGLIALEKLKPVQEQSKHLSPYQTYICAVYDSRQKKIIATADFFHSRIEANSPLTNTWAGNIWSIQSEDRIVYLNADLDTVALVAKMTVGITEKIPGFNWRGLLVSPDQKSWTVYQDRKPVWTFDQDPELFKIYTRKRGDYKAVVHNHIFKGRVNGAWGIFKLTPVNKESGAVNIKHDLQVDVIAQPIYDSISVPVWGQSLSIFKLVKGNTISWIDTSGRTLMSGSAVPYLSPYALADDSRLAFELTARREKDAPNERQLLSLRILMMDTTGKTLYTYNARPQYRFNLDYYPVDKSHVFYSKGTKNRLLNLNTGISTPILPLHLVDVALINGVAIGCWGTRESMDIDLLTLQPKVNKSVKIVPGNDKGKIFAHPGKKFDSFGPTFFDDALILYGENEKFLGVVNGRGELYD